MTNTYVNASLEKVIPGRANGYYEESPGFWINLPLVDAVVGPTNIYTTIEDLARWDGNFNTPKIGSHKVIEIMHQVGKLNNGSQLNYAFGLETGPDHQHHGWRVVEHGGNQGGYSSWMLRFPECQLSVIVLFNLFLWETRNYAIQVADLFLDDHPTPEKVQVQANMKGTERSQATNPTELQTQQMQEKVGKYFNAARAALREITLTNGKLQYQGFDLVPLSANRFNLELQPSVLVEFTVSEGEQSRQVKTIMSSGEFSYERVETITPTHNELECYAGRYYSPELDIYWIIIRNEDLLIVRRRKYVDSVLTPAFQDAFSDDWSPILGYPRTYLILFERDQEGTIIGLNVSGDGVRNLHFIR